MTNTTPMSDAAFDRCHPGFAAIKPKKNSSLRDFERHARSYFASGFQAGQLHERRINTPPAAQEDGK